MSQIIQILINSFLQILLFTLLPFIWWLISARQKENFFRWLGLKPIQNGKKNKTYVWITEITLVFFAVAVFILFVVKSVETATSQFSGLGIKALPAVLLYGFLNTALPEEILFRGFLLKRISSKFGFVAGNIVQAILFGLMHGIMFFSLTSLLKAVAILIFTGGIAWFLGYVNEKKAGGSILPSWIMHALSNVFSGLCAAFLLF